MINDFTTKNSSVNGRIWTEMNELYRKVDNFSAEWFENNKKSSLQNEFMDALSEKAKTYPIEAMEFAAAVMGNKEKKHLGEKAVSVLKNGFMVSVEGDELKENHRNAIITLIEEIKKHQPLGCNEVVGAIMRDTDNIYPEAFKEKVIEKFPFAFGSMPFYIKNKEDRAPIEETANFCMKSSNDKIRAAGLELYAAANPDDAVRVYQRTKELIDGLKDYASSGETIHEATHIMHDVLCSDIVKNVDLKFAVSLCRLCKEHAPENQKDTAAFTIHWARKRQNGEMELRQDKKDILGRVKELSPLQKIRNAISEFTATAPNKNSNKSIALEVK